MNNTLRIQLRLAIIFLLVAVMWGTCTGQVVNGKYQIGVMNTNNFMMKFQATMEISDSTVITTVGTQFEVRKIKSRSGNFIYTGDEIATDRITVNPIQGRLKGFQYTFAIIIDPDTKFKSPQVMYFARKY